MKNNKITRRQIKTLIFLSILLLTGIFTLFPFNNSKNEADPEKSKEKNEYNVEPKIIDPLEMPKSSLYGTHPWWQREWPYRMLITIRNQANVNLKNYGVYVDFPYSGYLKEGKVNATLKDVRIVEYIGNVGYERKYFIFQDFPSTNITRIFFNTNVSASATELDTYLYFGNMKVESTAVKYGLGLVKNGDFEYVPAGDNPVDNPGFSPYSYNPVGWNWSHNVPNNVVPNNGIPDDSPNDGTTIPSSYWQNCLVNITKAINQVQVNQGKYSYKWGTTESAVPNDSNEAPRATDDYNGVLFSAPFVVPIVGNGNPSVDKIYLNLWRNIRVCGFDQRSQNDNIDGYFIRIITAASGTDPNPDNHVMLGNFKEIFGGIGKNNKLPTLMNYTSGSGTNTVDTFLGQLSAPEGINIDLSNYMGQNISIEIGMFGDEGIANIDMAFGQIDNVHFTYAVNTVLNEIQIQKADVTVITRDVDGRIVPNAEVSLVQGKNILDTKITDENGEYIFSNLNFGLYNFTVNYTFSASVEQVVFNSTKANYGTSRANIYNVTEFSETFNLYCDIWTINFEIDTWDNEPLDFGYIKVYNQKGDPIALKTLDLDAAGTATFRWRNATRYYYEVYFDNDEYTINHFLLNSSYIYRADYESNGRNFNHIINVNENNIGSGGSYKINERIYSSGDLNFGLQMLIKANITLSNMNTQIDNVTVYYIDINNQTIEDNLIYENLSYPASTQNDFIELDIRLADNTKLRGENYEAYGLLIVVQGQNSTKCDGIITIDTIEKCHIYNKTAISKMHIRVQSAEDFSPIYPASVKITNGTNLVTILTTNTEGWASHDPFIYTPFMYLIGYSYNISIKRDGADKTFTVNSTAPEQWEPEDVMKYNYTLNQNSTIILDMQISGPPPAETDLSEVTSDTYVVWGEDISIIVNVTFSTDGSNWYDISEEGDFYCNVKSWSTGKIVLTEKLIRTPGLNYSIIINSSRISAGDNFEEYWFIISGSVSGYANPPDLYVPGKVSAKDTTLVLVDYETHLPITQLSKEFDELINVTVIYFNKTDTLLRGAIVTFNWQGLPVKYLQEDPLNIGYYYVTINTSEALSVGLKFVTIIALLENYTSRTMLTLCDVLERPTLINNNTGFYYFSQGIWIRDAHNYTFEYRDVIRDKRISDLDVFTYSWQQTDAEGNPIGISGEGKLVVNSEDLYILDFDTEERAIGNYLFYITLQKDNYELRSSVFHLTINIRPLEAELDATNLEDDLISVVKGDEVDFEVTVKDNSRGGIPLTGATVKIEIGGTKYDMKEEEPGVYRYTFKTDDVDAYFASKTYTTTITIEKLDFESQEIDATLVVQMEEIFPGIPAFYFWLVLAAISGVIGSLIGYKVVQQARIPIFVKKVRKVSKLIKSNKQIPLISIPTKDEMFLDDYEKEWSDIGVDLKNILGVKESKFGVLSKAKDIITKKGDTE